MARCLRCQVELPLWVSGGWGLGNVVGDDVVGDDVVGSNVVDDRQPLPLGHRRRLGRLTDRRRRTDHRRRRGRGRIPELGRVVQRRGLALAGFLAVPGQAIRHPLVALVARCLRCQVELPHRVFFVVVGVGVPGVLAPSKILLLLWHCELAGLAVLDSTCQRFLRVARRPGHRAVPPSVLVVVALVVRLDGATTNIAPGARGVWDPACDARARVLKVVFEQVLGDEASAK